MEFTWTIPVALILAVTTYAIFARFFAHRERMARIQTNAGTLVEGARDDSGGRTPGNAQWRSDQG